jgi:DNA-binding transcriptional LysR family regulator
MPGEGRNMNTVYFTYVLEIERTGSITKAAESLHIAQPNLSKYVKELEDSIGFPLFARSTKGVIPTKKGAQFLVYARKILDQMERISDLSDTNNKVRQRLSISIPRSSYIAEGFTNFVSELDHDKSIDINLQETNSMQTINSLEDNVFALGIIRYQTIHEKYFLDYLKDKNMDYDKIWEFEFVVSMSKNHELAKAPAITVQDLAPYTEIIDGDIMVPYIDTLDIYRSSPDMESQKRIYLYERYNEFDLLSTIPKIIMWTSPLPDNLLDRYGLILRKCKIENNSYKDILIYHRGYTLSELEKKFIDKIFEAKNKVSSKIYT